MALGDQPATESGDGAAVRENAAAILDANWYVAQIDDPTVDGSMAIDHFLSIGLAEGRSPSAMFDPAWYLENNPDVAAAGLPAVEHFLRYGLDERRDPHPLFVGSDYLDHYPDVAEARVAPFLHYARHGRAEGRTASTLFDEIWYLASYPDVASSGLDAWDHFVLHGDREGRSPGPAFDAAWYLATHPEANGAMNGALAHYLRIGRALGLSPKPIDPVAIGEAPPIAAAVPVPATPAARRPIPDNMLVNIPLTETFFATLTDLSLDSCDVSIVILSYRRPDFVENLVKSIWLFTTGLRYEIIVVDNGSPPGEHVLGRDYARHVRRIDLAYNHYIGDGYNIGVEQARGKYVVLMNNDIVVQPDWLMPLIKPLIEDETIGAVGPKFLYPTGELQEAGALIDASGVSIQLGKRGFAAAPEFNRLREVDYCTGATIATRRAEYIDLQGYDWRWQPGYYEDVDYCFKLREIGKRIIYQPKSTVFHLESATMSVLPPSGDLAAAVQTNRRAFVKKWQHLFDEANSPIRHADCQNSGRNLAIFERLAGASDPNATRVGIFIPYEFIPGGGEKYAISVAEAFADEVEITLIFPSQESLIRIISVLQAMDFPDLNIKAVTVDSLSGADPFDLFVLIGNELFPTRPGIGKKNVFICQFPFPVSHDFLAQLCDKRLHESYDMYIVYSDYVRERVRDRLHMWQVNRPIVTLPPTATFVGPATSTPAMDIVGVGRFFTGGHNKRHDVMIETMRLISAARPQDRIRLNLAGAVHRETMHREHLRDLQQRAEDLPIEFHLNIERADLEALYRRCAIYWHAAGWGVDVAVHPERVEHFGITIVEAMSAGCIPIVYAVGGPVEIVQHGVNGITVISEAELAEWTLRLIDTYDTPRVQEMRARAIETGRSYAKPAFRDRVRAAIPLG